MKFESNLSAIQKQLKNIEKEINRKVGSKTLADVLNDNFIRNNTKYNSFEEFQKDMPNVELTKYSAINEVDHPELNGFIKENTNFDNWNQMINKAYERFLR